MGMTRQEAELISELSETMAKALKDVAESLDLSQANFATMKNRGKIPFSNIFPFLEDLAIKNGGTSGTLGIKWIRQMSPLKISLIPIKYLL